MTGNAEPFAQDPCPDVSNRSTFATSGAGAIRRSVRGAVGDHPGAAGTILLSQEPAAPLTSRRPPPVTNRCNATASAFATGPSASSRTTVAFGAGCGLAGL